MSIQVAVRVRPFNNREIELGSELCVEMSGETTTLLHLDDPRKNRDFSFDFSFWSHSGFEIDSEGKSVPVDGKYNDQQSVYDLVGAQMLDNAWLGYHCCLLAYGQTGAGKSYSMIGYKPNRGIVPIACEEIFKRISACDNSAEYEVCLSMLEIYNERVQDLLIPPSKRPQGGLRIRENKTIGFYVEHLTKYPVKSYDAIESRMEEGSKNRSIASTQMNASSSRAHTIITIEFRKREMVDGRKIEKYSQINLVDLAGSEKVGKTGATGDRLKEAGQINKSLHILGLVIMTLAEIEGGKKGIKVPYRDSCLTRILCNALGGNSKTLMICAISPSNDNYDETLSTLRYADQAKRIKNRAIINETAVDKMIRELTLENQKLKSTIQELRQKILLNPALNKNEIEELEDQIKAMDDLMNDMQITHEQRFQETELNDGEYNKDDEDDLLLSTTHLTNLNEDPVLNNKIKFRLDQDSTYVGRKTAVPAPDIILGSVGIKEKHAIFIKIGDKVYLSPYQDDCSDFIHLNGEKVLGQKPIYHNDRIVFGTNSTFLVYCPDHLERPGQNLPKEIDWEFAQDEISKHEESPLHDISDIDIKEQEMRDQMVEKLRVFEQERESERKEYKTKIKIQIDKYEHKLVELGSRMKEESEKQKLEKEKMEYERITNEILAKLEAERIQKELQREKQKQAIERQEQHRIFKLNLIKVLEERLQKVSRRTFEAQFISKELMRNFTFTPIIPYAYIDVSEVSSSKTKEPKINILVKNLEDGYEYEWDLEKFQSRYYLIQELLSRYQETNEIPKVPQSEDPFWDPPEQTLIGQGYIKLFGLANGLDLRRKIILINHERQCGMLDVGFTPCNLDGSIEYNEDNCDDLGLEDPNDLLGKRLDFKIKIYGASLPSNFCQDTFVEYSLLHIDGSSKPTKFRTQVIEGKAPEPSYAYSKQHSYRNIQQKVIQYLSNSTLQFCVYGIDDERVDQMMEAKLHRSKNEELQKHQEQASPQRRNNLSGNTLLSRQQSNQNNSPKKTGVLKIENPQLIRPQKVSELAFPLVKRISSNESPEIKSVPQIAAVPSNLMETEPNVDFSEDYSPAPRKRVSSLDNTGIKSTTSSRGKADKSSKQKSNKQKKQDCSIF